MRLLNIIADEIKTYGDENKKSLLTKNLINNTSYFSQPDCVLFSYFKSDSIESFSGFLVNGGVLYMYKSNSFNNSCRLNKNWVAISNPSVTKVLGVNFIGSPVVFVEVLTEGSQTGGGSDIEKNSKYINIGIEY